MSDFTFDQTDKAPEISIYQRVFAQIEAVVYEHGPLTIEKVTQRYHVSTKQVTVQVSGHYGDGLTVAGQLVKGLETGDLEKGKAAVVNYVVLHILDTSNVAVIKRFIYDLSRLERQMAINRVRSFLDEQGID